MIRALIVISFCVLGLGGILNFAVIAANGWHMPILGGFDGEPAGVFGIFTTCELTSHTKLAALADIYPAWWGYMLSIGDIFILVGSAGFILFTIILLCVRRIVKHAAGRINDGPSPLKPF